ncbi:hypothetical protein BC941DRAFT_431560 [Chlamydoabsidia padenii]|nr:hypothetical protein BC941DRAFT_431560 [Chlamydoabsidia padenii]
MSSPIWFQGTINEAVQLVQNKNCLFMVFIHDDKEPSQQIDKLLMDAKVQDILQKHVSIKLDLDSENARMFGQFYPIQRVPMVYFIKQGIIKDFAIETTTGQEIIDKVDRLDRSDSFVPPPSTQTNIQSVAATNSPPSSSSLPMDTRSDEDTVTIANTDSNTEYLSSSSMTDMDKKAKLKQQMEQARARRDEIEKENEKQREIKRRQDGKEAQLTKQQLQDQQNKLYFAKIKKEKQADEEHRRKIKEQIARDREEKVAERQRRLQQQKESSQPSSSSASQQSKETRHHDVCHLNVRQGDGNNIRNTFKSQDKLEDVRTWIDENRTDGDQPYKLLAQFPTRHFSTGDEQKTLYDLDLVPSGTLIMKPIRNVASAYQSPSGASYSGMMADCIYSAGGMVYNTLSGVAGALGSMIGAVGPMTAGGSDGHRLGGPQTQPQASPSGSRQIHGINTLRQQAQTDDDERKKTYNGNSVNQE